MALVPGFERQWPMLDLRAGAFPYRHGKGGEIDLLLIRRTGQSCWSMPKGHVMAGRELHEAAAIEAHEEAGIRGRIERDAIGSFVHVKAPPRGLSFAEAVEVVLFPLEVQHVSTRWPEMAVRERRWAPAAEAVRLVPPGRLGELIREFEASRLLVA